MEHTVLCLCVMYVDGDLPGISCFGMLLTFFFMGAIWALRTLLSCYLIVKLSAMKRVYVFIICAWVLV